MSYTYTGEHLFVDNNSTATVEFFAAANTHLDLIKKYTNELAVSNISKYCLHTHDPITKQAEFYNLLSQSLLKLKENEEGSVDKKVNQILVQQLENTLSEDEAFILTNTGELETQVNVDTGLTEALVIDSDKQKRYVPIEKNVIDDINEIKNNLRDDYGVKSMNEELILFWIEKYKASHAKVKEEFEKLIPKLNKSVFQDYSDMMGIITRIEESLDRFTIPANDIKLENHDDLIPNIYNPVIEDKIDINTKNLVYEMTKKTESLFRQNIKNVIVAHGMSTVSHGENLVGDYRHWHRLRDVVTEFLAIIQSELGLLYDVIEWAGIAEDDNSQKTIRYSNKLSVERSSVSVDLLQNKIQSLQKNTTNAQVLSASTG